jgi:hypothetical protein
VQGRDTSVLDHLPNECHFGLVFFVGFGLHGLRIE